MNAKELECNEALGDFVVQDLNEQPRLSHLDPATFDLATCALSIDYLTSPLARPAIYCRTPTI